MPDKALVVSFYFPPLNTPATQHPAWFFEFMKDWGIDTTAVTSSVYFPGEAPEAPPADDIIRVPVKYARRFWRQVYRAELLVQGHSGCWNPSFIWAEIAARAAVRLLRNDRFSSMVSTSPTVASHWAGYRIKKRFPHLKWVADFQDPFLGNPFAHSKPFVRPIERRLENAIFSAADFVSANTNTVREMWQARYPAWRDKFVVTWGGYDPRETIAPLPLPARPAPVLAHVGSIYHERAPNALFEALGSLHRQGKLGPGQLVVELVGSNDLRAVENPAQLAGLQELGLVRLHEGHIPRSEALRISEEADYLLVLDITGKFNTKLQVPSKLFDYVLIGRPIIAFTPRNSPTEYILSRSGVPHVVIHNEGSPEDVEAGILRLLTLPPEPRPASPWFRETFDARQLAKSMAGLLASSPSACERS